MRFRLSLLIPALLTIIALISSVLIFKFEDKANRATIARAALNDITFQMAGLQSVLYNRLTEGDRAEALLNLSIAATYPNIRSLMLVGQDGKVLMANRYSWVGSPAQQVTAYEAEVAQRALQGGAQSLGFSPSDPDLLQGYFPLITEYRQGGLEKVRGVLYVEYDISAELEVAQATTLKQTGIYATITLISAFIVALLLHYSVSKRVARLSRAADHFASGDYAVRSHLQGGDELASLGRTFDSMAQQVQQQVMSQQRVVQTALDGYWLLDQDGHLLEVNEAYCRMSGYSRAELLQMSIPDLEARERTPDEVQQHMALIFARGWDRFETRHRHKDGHLFEVEISTTYWADVRQFFAFIHDVSERNRLHRRLQASKDQYDRLTSNIPIGVYLLRTSAAGVFDFRYVSGRFCAMLGVAAEAVYADARTPFGAIHPDDLAQFQLANQQAVTTHQPFRWEGRTLVDGVVRWIRIESEPELQENGDCIWNGVISDITERRSAQEALQREQARLQEAQRIGHFGSWELDLVSGQLVWSDEIFRLFEIDQDKFAATYEAFLNAIHPDDRDKVNQAYTDSLQDRQPYQITHRLQMPDGRIKWVEERCTSYFAADGKPLRSLGTVQDVTLREENQAELRIAAAAFETQEAIMVADRDANIIKVNRAFELTTGYTAAEIIGQNPRVLASGRHDKRFYQEMWTSIHEVGRWSGEVWDKRKDGTIYPKWLTITSVSHRGKVVNYVAVFVDISERKRVEEEIHSLAFFDPLTRLPNRRLLLDRLRLGMAQGQRSQNYGALLFIDLDHFKVLNDTRGHDAGDKLLIEVASRIKSVIRESDTVARFGGDEFVVLLEDLNRQQDDAVAQAGRVAEKIRDALSRTYLIDGYEHESSPSIGVSLFLGNAVSMEELLKRTDVAMYQAKEAGRNLVRFFEPSMQARLESRSLMEGALRHALQNDELEVHFQLQTNQSRQLLGAEVLLRWTHPVLGKVSPAQFIPLAEQSKLILPIGYWVLESACERIKMWDSHPVARDLHLAVNISPVQFHQADFVARVKSILARTGADPARLELELTENLVLENVDVAIAKMSALKELGVRFSMDDFGTGYSSLQYIKRLPINMLKIDQSFVRDILTDPGDAVMVQTIADLAKNFGFAVIAEGVESQDQLAPLIERGCDSFQGYLFSRPVPVAEFERIIAGWEKEHV